ncbi:MAG: serine hydrolase domain-containing protein, partial [Bacteroidota bacterium]
VQDFSLVFAIANDHVILKQGAYGWADRTHQVPNQLDTKFNIASIGKLFTAVAILQLKQAGKLNLNDPPGKYLPNLQHKGLKDSITIHQLLTHTAGLPLWFNEQFANTPKFHLQSLHDYLPLIEKITCQNDWKGTHHYSNVGYFILGLIIESISGQSYPNYVEQYIFAPVQMEHTGYWPIHTIEPNRATGYTRPTDQEKAWTANERFNMNGGPAGGAWSTCRDLIRFYWALKNHQLLDHVHTQLLFRPQVSTGYGHYGYGIGLQGEKGAQKIGHLGGFYGIRGELMWYIDQNRIVAILANSDQTSYLDLSYFLQTQWYGSKADQAAYANSLRLWKTIKNGGKELLDESYDEQLLQIKAYHAFNNNQLDLAQQLFQLNLKLSPDSIQAKLDLQKCKKRIAARTNP